MARPPQFEIDPTVFAQNPYPQLAEMRDKTPVCFVPQLQSVLFTKRDDIAECEKNIDVFSSDQPDGLMTQLMGQNMMRKDGEAHALERKATFQAYSPKTVRDVWKARFEEDTKQLLTDLKNVDEFDLVRDYALPISGNALRIITGLEKLTPQQIDWISQSMIDGISNYAGDMEVERECREATEFVDHAIDERLAELCDVPDTSLISIQAQAGLPIETIRANVKLAISGGQNEPRDAIAGVIWALLEHPDQLHLISDKSNTWFDAFEEYVRWIAPIGMSPRRVAQNYSWNGLDFAEDERVFFMFGSANHDEDYFDEPSVFDITRDASKHIAFGAGPHFCAGAAASRTLITEVALPMIFETFPDMETVGDVVFEGWAFRGPREVRVKLNQ